MSDEESQNGESYATFPIDWQGEFQTRQIQEGFLLDLFVKGNAIPYQIAATALTSRGFFENQEQVTAWFERTIEIFGEGYTQTVMDALGSLLMDASRLSLVDLGLSPFDKEAVLHDHATLGETLARRRFKMETRRAARWASTELSVAISAAMSELAETNLTYDSVAAKLQEDNPERAPKTGESLRKMVVELKINWMGIKQETRQKRNKTKKRSQP